MHHCNLESRSEITELSSALTSFTSHKTDQWAQSETSKSTTVADNMSAKITG